MTEDLRAAIDPYVQIWVVVPDPDPARAGMMVRVQTFHRKSCPRVKELGLGCNCDWCEGVTIPLEVEGTA